MTQPQQLPQLQLQYFDRPEIPETFADYLKKISVFGPVLRIEFCVVRPDESQAGQPSTGKEYTACRLVLPITALIPMISELNQVLGSLQSSGTLKLATPAPVGGKAN
jgi:hypothetical protein